MADDSHIVRSAYYVPQWACDLSVDGFRVSYIY